MTTTPFQSKPRNRGKITSAQIARGIAEGRLQHALAVRRAARETLRAVVAVTRMARAGLGAAVRCIEARLLLRDRHDTAGC